MVEEFDLWCHLVEKKTTFRSNVVLNIVSYPCSPQTAVPVDSVPVETGETSPYRLCHQNQRKRPAQIEETTTAKMPRTSIYIGHGREISISDNSDILDNDANQRGLTIFLMQIRLVFVVFLQFLFIRRFMK